MAYDEELAGRVRALVAGEDAVAEIAMFGGLCFTSRGNMICGVVGDELMARVAPDGWEDALAAPHARAMDFTGRPMRGFVFVGRAAWSRPATLRRWIERCAAYVRTLPAKAPKPRRVSGPGGTARRAPRAR